MKGPPARGWKPWANFELGLGGDGVVLVHPPVQNYLLVRGTQAIWLANAVGRSTIKASGGVSCPSGQACPLLLAVFGATVEVVP